MKKNFYVGLIALTALTVTSCSNDDVVMQSPEVNKAIEFGTYVGRDAVSRGHVIEVDELAKEGFGVFAYYTNDGDFVATDGGSAGNTASTPNFMYNQKVSGKETTSDGNTTYSPTEWEYTPLKYWPNESTDKLSFFAYAPYSEGGNGTNFTFNSEAGLPTLGFTVNDDVKKQQDLLWAEPHLNLVKNQATNGQDIDDEVKFEFKHALARIGFDVQTMIDKVNGDDVSDDDTTNDEDDETKTEGEGNNATTVPNNGENLATETTVVVKKVELSGNFITSGTLAWTRENDDKYAAAITNTAQNAATQTTYTLEAKMEAEFETNFAAENQNHSLGAKDDSKVTVHGQSANQTEAQLNADDSYIMIIPKEFKDNDKLTIKVYYDVITEDGNLTSGYSLVSNEISTSFSGVKFDAGKAYKFSLHLGLTSVKLEAEVADWDEENGKDWAVNLPLNIEDDDTPAGGTGSGDSND